ncbi:MAG: hypothetical protein ACOYK9_04020 [Chlamydiia bacterium]
MGAVCVFTTGLCYFLITLCALIAPKPIASYVASKSYFADFTGYRYYFITLKYLMTIACASTIGVVISLYHLDEKRGEGWRILLSVLAIVGLGIGMLQNVLDATQIPHLVTQYDKAPPIIQHVMIAFGVADPAIYMLSLGIPGVWLIFINYIHRNEFSRFLVFFGLLWGFGSILTVIAHLFVLIWLIYLIAAGALVGVPLWTFFQWVYLKKKIDECSL